MRFHYAYVLLRSVGLSIAISGPTFAVPYASAVRNTTGSDWEFVLNEGADSYTVKRDGGNEITVNNPSAGRHTFDLEAFSTFEISVANSIPATWTEISDANNLHTNYFRPNGVVVNKDPSSPFFGTIYVSNPFKDTNPLMPAGNRAHGRGIYSLTADRIGVNLANFSAIANADDPSLGKAPGWFVGGNQISSPWQITLDDAHNVIVSDRSDTQGGFKYASPDLTTGGFILVAFGFHDGTRPLNYYGTGQEVHGSINSKPTVTGSVGNGLTIWGIDEDFDLDGDTFVSDDGYHLWRWDVGNATDYDQPPSLEISGTALNFGEARWRDLSLDSLANDAHYEPQYDKWYMTQSRTHGDDSSLIIVSADGVDGTTPTIEWASKQFSIDNGLDGNDGLGREGIQDIFRTIGSVVISDDGTKLFAHRARQYADDDVDDGGNPVLGAGSNLPGSILVIPLDENGLPDIQIDDNGTPGNTSDDFLTNLESITIERQLGRNVRSVIDLDAAGNVYITSSLSELLQVFSPGGDTVAITGSNGTFSLQTPAAGLPGD